MRVLQIGVRNGEERRWRRSHGRDAPGARHEEYRSGRHGGYPGHLRTYYSRDYLHGYQPHLQALLFLRRVRAPGVRLELWACGSRCR